MKYKFFIKNRLVPVPSPEKERRGWCRSGAADHQLAGRLICHKTHMQVQLKSVGNDVNGAASVRTGDTASGRGGSKATQIVNKQKPCKMLGWGPSGSRN